MPRGADRDDHAVEFAPEFGRMLMFRVHDHSWHGFLPRNGQCMSLLFCYVDSAWCTSKEYPQQSVSSFASLVPLSRKAIDPVSRHLPGTH